MGFGEFSELGLVQPLTEISPHRIEHHHGQLALSWVRGDLGGLETDTFAGVIGVEVGLALFGVSHPTGHPLASSLSWSRVDVLLEESRARLREVPDLVYVEEAVPSPYGFFQFGGAPRPDQGALFIRVSAGDGFGEQGSVELVLDARTT